MDISGTYTFTEDFGYGKDEGEATLVQKGNFVSGELSFTESIEDEDPFSVTCQLEGRIEGSKVFLSVNHYDAGSVEYYPEDREGVINSAGQIVGSSEDEQGVCGIFIFSKKS